MTSTNEHTNGDQNMTITEPATGTVETPEVVDAPPSTAVEKAPPVNASADAALEAATRAALEMPGIAGRDEFLALAMQARVLSLSGAAPKIIRENPHVALHVAMIGRDLGISPSASIELIDVLETSQGPRISLSPQLLNGQIRRLGLGSIIPVVRTAERCVAASLAPGGEYDMRCRAIEPEHVADCRCRGVLGTSEFTWGDAQLAMLIGRECTGPNAHSEACKSTNQVTRGYRCAFGYKTYPKRMMWWRASGFAADDYFPEAGLGLYTAEELGATVDAEGRPIDVMSVELPPGYEATTRSVGSGSAASTGDEAADPADVAYLSAVLAGVDLETRAKLKGPWSNSVGAPVADLNAKQARSARALLRGMVKDPDADDVAATWWSGAVLTIAAAGLLGARPIIDGSEHPGDAQPDPVAPTAAEPAEVATDDPGRSDGTPEPDRPKHPKDDPRALEAVEMVKTATDDAAKAGWTPEQVQAIVDTVKVLHHAKVRAQLLELDPESDVDAMHIDIARCFLVAYKIDEMRGNSETPL